MVDVEADPPTPGVLQSDPARSERAFLRALAIILIILALLLAWPFRTAIIFAFVVGLMFQAPHRHLTRWVRKASISAILLLFVLLLAIVAPLGLLVFLLVQEAIDVAESLRDAGGPRPFLADLLDGLGLSRAYAESTADRVVTRVTEGIGEFLVPALNAITEITVGLVIFFILAFFVIVDGPKMARFIRDVVPLRGERKDRLFDQTRDRVFAVVYGSFVVAIIQGVVAGLGWWILGMPNPVFWGFVMLVLSIVPIVGAFVVLLPAAVYAFMQGDLVAGIGLVVLNFIAVGLIDDVLRPYIVGRRSRVHPAMVLVGMIGGVVLMGVGGIILGPIILAALPPVLEAWRTPGGGTLNADEPAKEPRGRHASSGKAR